MKKLKLPVLRLTLFCFICSILLTWSKTVNAQETISSNDIDSKFNIVDANTNFGFKLFSEVLKKENDNVFISPLSISLALDMVYNGAELETKKAIESTLELSGLSSEDINKQTKRLTAALENKEKEKNPISLKIANSLWVDKDFQLKKDFLQKTKDDFQAKVSNLDFSSPKAIKTINKWVGNHTNNKIRSIIDRLDPAAKLVVVNAIYFNGTWEEKFNKNQTKLLPFHKTSGEKVDVPMMSQNGNYRYLETDNFQAISLPYTDQLTSTETEFALPENGATSLYVFLPKIHPNSREFYQNLFYHNLTAENWRKWLKQFSNKPGLIKLPRFKMDYSISLNNILKKLGLEIAFSNKANFSGISTSPLMISEVLHKTFVDINEEGTEAAAVTALTTVGSISSDEIKPFNMIVDHGFFCAIVDNHTGSILFMGAIETPSSGNI